MRWGSRECMKAGGSRRCSRFVFMGCGILFHHIPDLDLDGQGRGQDVRLTIGIVSCLFDE
jgi:hypothetical protein